MGERPTVSCTNAPAPRASFESITKAASAVRSECARKRSEAEHDRLRQLRVVPKRRSTGCFTRRGQPPSYTAPRGTTKLGYDVANLSKLLDGKPTLVEWTETKPPVLATNRPRCSALPEASFGAQFCVGGSPRASFGTQRALLAREARAGDRPNGVGCL